MPLFLSTPIEYLKGVGPIRAEMLRKELHLDTFGDLITFFPFRYVDRSMFHNIREVKDDVSYVQIKGKITELMLLGQGRATRLVATLKDATGEIELIWFAGIKWVKEKVKTGGEYVVFGKPVVFNNKFNIPHPEIETLASFDSQPVAMKLQPFYNSTEKLKSKGLDSRGIAKIMRNLIAQSINGIPETLRPDLIKNLGLISREVAMQHIHFPDNPDILRKAISRLKFEELFFIQLKLLQCKILRKQKSAGFAFPVVGSLFKDFYSGHLPFELTGAQKRVIREIRLDLGGGKQMNRLLQGDVGSGKTLVALMCMLMALDNGFQACIMAPTEILATQHFETIQKFIGGMPVSTALLTGSVKGQQRKEILKNLAEGSLNILNGTHALIEEKVQFNNLGFVVIDEQHRFGVEQRAKLWTKNATPPHILVMTATPIPRTLAMTLYGDLDISVIDEMPPGRKQIKTRHFYEGSRLKVFGFIRDQIQAGRQIYIVYPLIHESEKLDLKDLIVGYESICRSFPAPEYAVSIVHGQMKHADKEFEMKRFQNRQTQIMVSTTVIEVGVDIPNATVMIVENAERFGLSQLHQLRGRVGRGAEQSWCILMTSDKLGSDARNRIATMVRTTDGFEIAEADLRLRGPGDLQGLQQSGMLNLKIADLINDENILKQARQTAQQVLDKDNDLCMAENALMVAHLKTLLKDDTNWGLIS